MRSWERVISFALSVVSVGIGLKFLTFLDKWVYFPFFPDIVDALVLACLGFCLLALTFIDCWKYFQDIQHKRREKT
jgi:hypothetical protein